MMSKEKFEQRIGEKISDREWVEIRTIWYATGAMNADLFCEEYRLTGLRVARCLAKKLLIERAYLKKELKKAQKANGTYVRPKAGEVKYIPMVTDMETIYNAFNQE